MTYNVFSGTLNPTQSINPAYEKTRATVILKEQAEENQTETGSTVCWWWRWWCVLFHGFREFSLLSAPEPEQAGKTRA